MDHFAAVLSLAVIMLGVVAVDVLGEEPGVAHMVYFKLNSSTPEGRAKLVASCDKYLDGHEGTVYYSAGVLAEDLDREVNVRDFDVALHLVFENKAAHDKYQKHPRHLKFIEENKSTWAGVRVFDAYVRSPSSSGGE